MSIQPTKLIIIALALAVICLAGRIMDLSKTVVATPRKQVTTTQQRTRNRSTDPHVRASTASPQKEVRITELDIYIANPEQLEK